MSDAIQQGEPLSFRYVEHKVSVRMDRAGSAKSRRLTGSFAGIREVSLPLAMPQGFTGGIADALLMQTHVERERAELTLPPSALALDPGDVIEIDTGARSVRMRIEQIGLDPSRPASGMQEEPEVYNQDDGPEVVRIVPRSTLAAPAIVYLLDLPLLRDEDAASAHAPRLAAYGQPWASVDIYRGPTPTSNLTLDTQINVAATIGALAAPLVRGPVSRWDEATVFTVEIGAGIALASADELAVLGGVNAAAVQTSQGHWEILQWKTATLIAPRIYELTSLLRGQLGTDSDMEDEIATGAAFVVLDDAVVASELPASLARAEHYWAWGPASKPPSDVLYEGATLVFDAIGLRPYAPVHVEASREDDDDILISWIRRSRIGADSWDQTEIPLGETTEAYEVDILDGVTVLRTLASTTPAATYSATDQAADWGGLAGEFTAVVYQLAPEYGRGAGRRIPIDV